MDASPHSFHGPLLCFIVPKELPRRTPMTAPSMRSVLDLDMNMDKENQGKTALEARAVLSELIDAAASDQPDRLDAAVRRERSRHPDLQDEATVLRQYKDANGRTALHFAAHAGQTEMVRHILAIAPDGATWADEKGDTPLTLAVAGGAGRLPLVELLLEKGADPNAGSQDGEEGPGVRALHHAAAHDDAPVVKHLLAAGADVEAATATGTPLHWAAGEGAQGAMKVLLDQGKANANATNAQGLAPIILAAAHGCGGCVAALAEAGADVGFILSGGGLTALHMLAEYGNEEGVRALLATEQGRKCALHESEHGKPVHLAAWGGHKGLVELLLPHSGVQESVDELMAWGKARAAAYEEEQRAAAEHNNGGHGHLGGRDVHHHGAMGLPPAAESPEAAAEAQKKKEEANRAFVGQEYDRALALYGEAIALDGRDPAFWSNRSGCHMKLGDFEAALADAEMARALKPDWPKACYRMAEARLALKRYEDAALAAYEGIQMDGGNQALHRLLKQAIDLGREEHQQKAKAEAGGAGGKK